MNEKRAGRSPGPREFIALFALITSLTALTIDTMLPALAATDGAPSRFLLLIWENMRMRRYSARSSK